MNYPSFKETIHEIKDNEVPEVSFHCQNVGDTEAKEIAKFLKNNNSITRLFLGNNRIGEAGAKSLAEALKINQSIIDLSLERNYIGDAGTKEIAEALKINKSITILHLSKNNIGDVGVKYLAKSLMSNQRITRLFLDANQIGDVGAMSLGETLKINQSIVKLSLRGNKIGDAGMKDIAEALKSNQSLTILKLSKNKIGDVGVKYLAEILEKNYSISSVYLSSNQIGDAGAKHIAKALKNNKSLTTIDLIDNKIGNVGVEYFVESLKNNQTIISVWLQGNPINVSLENLEQLLERNYSKKNQDTASLNKNPQMKNHRQQEMVEPITSEKSTANEYVNMIKTQHSQQNVLCGSVECIPNTMVANIFTSENEDLQFSSDFQATIKKITDLIREGNHHLLERSRKGILLLGNTGAGKSTLAHALSGRKLQAIWDDCNGELVIDALHPHKDIIIGHAASETKIPNRCIHDNLTIWDCPGFYDTDHVQEIANTFYIKRLFEITEQLKFVLVVPESALSSSNIRGSIFVETLSNFIKSFDDIGPIIGSVSLVVTHVPPTKTINHVKQSIDKILANHQSATREHSLIKELKGNQAIHLFYKPSGEGKLAVPDLLAKINIYSKYYAVFGEMVNITISKKALDCSLHLLKTVGNNFNQLLDVIVKAVCKAGSNINPCKEFSDRYDIVKDWVPLSMQYNEHLSQHIQYEYFPELNFLMKLQQELKMDPVVSSISDAIIIFQNVLETFANFNDSRNIDLQHKIQDYGYCLQQQYEYVKFFASVCKAQLPDHSKIAKLLKHCHVKVTENIEQKVSSLPIDENRNEMDYYLKVIEYLEKYPDSSACKKGRAVAYTCMANIAKKNGDQESVLLYGIKALQNDSHLPIIYETIGELFFNRGKYAKAIDCYKVINSVFRIKECFKAWLDDSKNSPDVMLKQAECFESIGLFEKAKKYYHYAFVLSQDDDFKAAALEKIGNIMINAVSLGEDFIMKAKQRMFYNFSLVNEKFIRKLQDGET